MSRDNFAQVLLDRFEQQPGAACFRFFREGAWHDMSYGEAGARARAIAGGLVGLGLTPGDRVAIVSRNRVEWALADLAAILAGCVSISAYPELTAEDTGYILAHAGARVAFVEDERQCRKLIEESARLPELQRIVVFDSFESTVCVPLDAFEKTPADPAATEERLRAAASSPRSTPLTIVYTSGTTGQPKGAILTHGNVLSVVETLLGLLGQGQVPMLNLSFLPLAHAFERIGGHFAPLYFGGTIAYARGLDTVAEDFAVIRPEYAMAVPRFFEKVYDRVQTQIRAATPLRRAVARWAIRVGKERSRCNEAGRRQPSGLRLRAALADRLVFSKIRNRLGGRMRFLVSGGAPLNPEIARFFHGAGLLICEGYGATETSAPATVNTPTAFRFGSVGRSLPNVHVKLAPDGELLVKGPNVFAGYFRDPEATREAFDADGYYRTGDIGTVDADGFFTITDRKKELLITAAGKNIAPQKIENLLRERPFISNALVHCDCRPYLVALLTLDRPAVAQSRPDLAARPASAPEIHRVLAEQVAIVNERLARFEQVKEFRVLETDFATDTGEITLTFKLKRRVIEARYRGLLDEMYAATDAPR